MSNSRYLQHQKAIEIELRTSEETEQLGFYLAQFAGDGIVIALKGPLGAGKTTLTQGAGRQLDVSEVINSPTFTMLNEYRSGRMPLYHMDLYRLLENDDGVVNASAATLEMLQSELDELQVAPALLLVEWPEAMEDYISQRDFVLVELNYSKTDPEGFAGQPSDSETGRVARISAFGPLSSRIVDSLSNVYFS